MELIYVYADKFYNFIEKQQFVFSRKFDINYDKEKRKLFIKNRNYIKDFFGKQIENVTLIIGKNGTGKTTLLELLGMTYSDRCRKSKEYKDKYFLLYHIKDNIFAIEGYGLSLIKDVVSNLPLKDKFHISDPYSIIIERNIINNDYKYNYVGYMNNEFDESKKVVKEEITYVSVKEKSDDTYLDLERLCFEENNTIFANRGYINHIGIAEKYDLLNFFIERFDKRYEKIKKGDFLNTDVNITIKPKFEGYKENKGGLDIKLNKNNNSKAFIKTVEKSRKVIKENKLDIKHNFILNFLEKYIYESFKIGLIRGNDGNKIERKISKEIQDKVDILYDNVEDKDSFPNKVKYLLNIVKIINNKMEEEYLKLGNKNKYYHSIEEFINSVKKVNKEFFESNCLKIPVNLNSNKEIVMQLLNIIDKYKYGYGNNLPNNLEVKFENLSSGESAFLDILTRIRESLKMLHNKNTVILLLDEPDKALHPEWSRSFIYVLLQKMIEMENIKCKYQVVISTHSPFMLSDVPSNNSIFLEGVINEKGKHVLKVKNNSSNTFGANIHTLLTNSFFMDNTIGEFANRKIKEVVKDLNEKSAQEILKIDGRKEEIQYIIDSIGEPVIKRKIENMYNKKFQYFNMNKKIQELSDKVNRLENKIGEDKLEKIIEIVNEMLGE